MLDIKMTIEELISALVAQSIPQDKIIPLVVKAYNIGYSNGVAVEKATTLPFTEF